MPAEPELQLLTFMMGDQECAFDTSSVLEIRTYDKPSAVSGVPDYVAGIINLRGAIIPLVDVRRKLNLPRATATPFTATVILSWRGGTVGAIVDRVCEVLPIRSDQMTNGSVVGDGLEYIRGIVSLDDRLIVAIDFDRLVAHDDLRFFTC